MTAHEDIIERLRALAPEAVRAQLPPAIFAEMGLRLAEYKEGRGLTCGFPAQARFANPWGLYQGGALMAAFDIAFGCLATLELHTACTTLSMESAFVRPLPADGAEFLVQVRLRAKTKSVLFMEGKARGAGGRTVATATTAVAPVKGDLFAKPAGPVPVAPLEPLE